MDWMTVTFGIFDGKRGHKKLPGIQTDGVDLRRTPRQDLYIEGRITAPDWPAVTRELTEYWLQIAAVYDRCLPAEPPLDTLIVEIEPEGGQLKTFLQDSTRKRIVSPLVLNGIVDIMADAYENLPAPDGDEEEVAGFEQGIQDLRTAAHKALLDSLATPQASIAINGPDGLVTKHKLKLMLRWEGEPDEPLDP